MECAFCNNQLPEEKRDEIKYLKNDELIIIKNVPVWVCETCQLIYYTEDVLNKIREFKTSVPTIDFEEI